jgi:hypothetical protein
MSFKLYFAGLACLIRKSADEYLVALPDGVTTQVNPCSGTMIDRHEPFLIIPIGDVVTSEVAGRIIDGCFVASLAKAQSLNFVGTEAGTIDDGGLAVGHHWSDIDPSFSPAPGQAILTMTLKNGTLASQSVPFIKVPNPKERSVFTAVHVQSDETGQFSVRAGRDEVMIKDGAEVLVANVSPEWIVDAEYPDDDDHFYIYYKMSANMPGCMKPAEMAAPDLLSKHPFLNPERSLRLSCSNTIYP